MAAVGVVSSATWEACHTCSTTRTRCDTVVARQSAPSGECIGQCCTVVRHRAAAVHCGEAWGAAIVHCGEAWRGLRHTWMTSVGPTPKSTVNSAPARQSFSGSVTW